MTRHGESTGNVAWSTAAADVEEVDLDERDADVPLSDLGRIQAAALGRRLAAMAPDERPTAVVCSPYVRTLDTARIALAELPWQPSFEVDERLRDREVGSLTGLTEHGVGTRFPDEAIRKKQLGKFYYRPPGGESWADVVLRLRSVYNDIDLDHAGERVLVVAHDAVVVMTRYIIERLSEQEILQIEKAPIRNCSISRWIRQDGRLRRAEYNDTGHLDALSSR